MSRRTAVLAVSLLLAGGALGAGGVLLWQEWRLAPSSPTSPPRVWEATVYLPLHDNHGNDFPEEEWQAAIHVLVKRFGGATLGGQRQGFWLEDDSHVQTEPIRLLTVSFERHRLDDFRRAVAKVGRRLGQQSMYVRFKEARVELIAGQAEGPKKDR